MTIFRRRRMNRKIRRLIVSRYTNTVCWPLRFAR